MSSITTSGDGRKEALVGQALSCPRCHAPLNASNVRRSGWLAPVWLRLLVLVLLLAALAAPLGWLYHLRARVLDNASAAARNYLDRLRAKDAKTAKELMKERARNQPNTISLQNILALDNASYEITRAHRNGALVDVLVTCIVPADAKLPKLPLPVDKDPKIKLVLDQENDGQWRIDTVSLLPKEGTNALPDFGPMKRQLPSMGK